MAAEWKARMLIMPFAFPGRVLHGLCGTAGQLRASGWIDHHRRLPGIDGTMLDVYVVGSRIETGPRDGKKPTPSARGTVVFFHGLWASKAWWLRLSGKLARCGWDCVLIDLRAHGRSEGQYTTWGAKEKHDARVVVDALLNEGLIGPRILAVGSSMGAAAAIQYAAVDARCNGVLAFAPPKSCREITRRILLMDSEKTYRQALERASELAAFDPDDAAAEAAAGKLTCPLYLVHGLLDVVVPYQHSQAIQAAASGPARLFTCHFAGHGPETGRVNKSAEWIDGLDAQTR